MTVPDSSLPNLVTCSYTGYERRMGTAVRITLGAPRFIQLPDPRYSDFSKWPFIPELAPTREYWRAPLEVYRARYLAQLEQKAADIVRKLGWIKPEHGAVCLLCYEKDLTKDWCHRRMFAEWWEGRTGRPVLELGGGR